jgi:hypothetical protein
VRIPLSLRRAPEPVGVLSPICNHPLDGGQTTQLGDGSGAVTDLACGNEELQRTTLGVRDSMQLGVQPNLGPPDQAPAMIIGPSISARRLDAMRCAFSQVVSIMLFFCSVPSVANPSIILAKTPMPPHRFQRLKRDFGVRYTGDT